MFPLGSVLLPSMLLPLHIFEERYRIMMRDVLEAEGRFGVVMIERGSEVGGEDVRASVGCEATIMEAEEQADGRWFLVAVGSSVIEIDSWLPDDPYPRALVRARPDRADGDLGVAPSMDDDPRWLELDSAFRSLLEEVSNRFSVDAGRDLALSEDPGAATFQMAAVAPIATLDRYRVLSADSAERRRTVLLEAFADAALLIAEGGLPD